jgi:hypothetical protein
MATAGFFTMGFRPFAIGEAFSPHLGPGQTNFIFGQISNILFTATSMLFATIMEYRLYYAIRCFLRLDKELLDEQFAPVNVTDIWNKTSNDDLRKTAIEQGALWIKRMVKGEVEISHENRLMIARRLFKSPAHREMWLEKLREHYPDFDALYLGPKKADGDLTLAIGLALRVEFANEVKAAERMRFYGNIPINSPPTLEKATGLLHGAIVKELAMWVLAVAGVITMGFSFSVTAVAQQISTWGYAAVSLGWALFDGKSFKEWFEQDNNIGKYDKRVILASLVAAVVSLVCIIALFCTNPLALPLAVFITAVALQGAWIGAKGFALRKILRHEAKNPTLEQFNKRLQNEEISEEDAIPIFNKLLPEQGPEGKRDIYAMRDVVQRQVSRLRVEKREFADYCLSVLPLKNGEAHRRISRLPGRREGSIEEYSARLREGSEAALRALEGSVSRADQRIRYYHVPPEGQGHRRQIGFASALPHND